jgi:hypothetical protein
MNKTVEIKAKLFLCTKCGKRISSGYCCMGCGLVYCIDCDDKELTDYAHSLFFHGSHDGKFCKKCMQNPPKKIRPLLTAYKKMKVITDSWEHTYKQLEKGAKIEEDIILSEITKLKLRGFLVANRDIDY